MRQQFTNSTELPPEIYDGPKNGPNLSKTQVSNDKNDKVVQRLRLVWSQRRFLLRLAGLGLVLGIVVAFIIPKRYESITLLMPPDQSNSGMAMLSAALGGGRAGGGSGSGVGSLGAIAGDLLGMKTSTDLFIGILQSRTVEDDVIDKFDLRKVYQDRYIKDARKDLEEKTEISSDKKSGIIKIRVIDHDPKRAAAMAGEYVAELDRLVAKVNTTSAHREREFLEARLTEVNGDLESAEKQFSEFASKNTALDIPTQGKAMIEAAAALKGQLIVSQMELQGIRQIYSDGNVRVRGLQARVDEIEKQMQQLGGAANDASDSSGQKGDASLFPSIRRLPALGVNYADLYRATKVQEAIFETLTQEYELAKVQEAKETPSVKLIDSPDVPEKQYFPRRSLIAMGGLFLFVLCGVGWIFGTEQWGSIDPSDPGKAFVMEVASSLKGCFSATATNGNGAGHPAHSGKEEIKSAH